MGLFLLDYGAGNVRSLANTLQKLGYEFQWISSADDFADATRLIFPGVGAFKSAIVHLQQRGLLEPLKQYIASGRPYLGICIGMQVLFLSSQENPDVAGLGLIPCAIGEFDDSSKSVPHMGWNAAELIEQPEASDGGGFVDPKAHYYFVHSFRATYDPEKAPDSAKWAHTTTQYGQEVFISSVRKDNVFATQFHPEKSGEAGLRLIQAWMQQSDAQLTSAHPTPRIPRPPRPRDGLTKRIIACMDVRANDEGDLVVTKGDQYDVREKAAPASSSTQPTTTLQAATAGAVRNLGKPVALAARYYDSGADELCLLNITSFRHSPLRDQPMLAVVREAAARVFVPLTIGGGIKDTIDPDGTPRPALEVASAYFRAGADKVSIGSEAVYAVERLRSASSNGKGDGRSAIETIAAAYGRQAVVVSVDPKRVYVDGDASSYDGPYRDELIVGREGSAEAGKVWWYQCTVSGGREARDLSVVQLARGAETLGAGEILLNSIDRDGTGLGFDVDLIRLVRKAVRIPVVASSGAGNTAHFTEVFQEADVEAALAAGIFHREEVKISDVKQAMIDANIPTRNLFE